MLLMVDLLCLVLKYCGILTIVRLASTAFNWEFGVSRNYLRLLELLFYLGEKRIEKAESINRLAGNGLTADCAHVDDDHHNSKAPLESDNEIGRLTSSRSTDPLILLLDKDKDEQNDMETTAEAAESRQTKARNHNPKSRQIGATNQKLRRISTPDGPPVFLLDDDDDDDDDDEDDDDDAGICINNFSVNSNSNRLGAYNNTLYCLGHQQHEFHLVDACKLVVKGLSAIIDDEVTKRFTPEELKSWNLLTRTNAKNYHFMSRSLGLYWMFGLAIRYAILLPMRIMFTLTGSIWLIGTMTIVGLLPRPFRHRSYSLMSRMSFRMLSCGLTSRLTFHNRQFRARKGDICVANHTSPLDVVILACDNCYSLVGQRHGGLIGILETALSRATNQVWFDRSEMRDRQLVTQRLKEHVNNKSNLPVLIFPEGTCINNSAVMLFRKGSFECSNRVCPVAIKYDSRFGDPFWNSSKHSYVQYLLLMMSSWAIKCEVWYLPPMERRDGESSAEFAGRVKAEIARQGGLEDLNWDGQLKRSAAKEQWKFQQQEDYVRRLKLE